jgi:hypothetical protein
MAACVPPLTAFPYDAWANAMTVWAGLYGDPSTPDQSVVDVTKVT